MLMGIPLLLEKKLAVYLPNSNISYIKVEHLFVRLMYLYVNISQEDVGIQIMHFIHSSFGLVTQSNSKYVQIFTTLQRMSHTIKR